MVKAIVVHNEKNLYDVINIYDEMQKKLNLASRYSEEKMEHHLNRIVKA